MGICFENNRNISSGLIVPHPTIISIDQVEEIKYQLPDPNNYHLDNCTAFLRKKQLVIDKDVFMIPTLNNQVQLQEYHLKARLFRHGNSNMSFKVWYLDGVDVVI